MKTASAGRKLLALSITVMMLASLSAKWAPPERPEAG